MTLALERDLSIQTSRSGPDLADEPILQARHCRYPPRPCIHKLLAFQYFHALLNLLWGSRTTRGWKDPVKRNEVTGEYGGFYS